MATDQGPLPNLNETFRPSLYAASIITYTLATGAVILRFAARRITHMNFWWDDWLVVGAWAGVTGFFITLQIWISFGLGLHYQAITNTPYLEIARHQLLSLFIAELFYSTATVFCKLSLLAFYWRIFNVANIRWPIRIMATCTILWLVARYIAIVLHCIPVNAYWDKTIQPATCKVNDRQFFMGTNMVNFVFDLIILLMPIPFIRRLQIRKAQKLAVFGMFGLGSFIVAVSIILLVVCFNLNATSPDLTWTLCPVAMWAGTEINLGVVTACLPSLRPVWTFIMGRGPNSENSHTHDYHQNSTYKSKTGVSLGSRSRTINAYSFNDPMEKDNQFSMHGDRRKILDESSSREIPEHSAASMDMDELEPPQGKVMVRDDISVNYTHV